MFHTTTIFVILFQCCIDLKKNVLHIGTTGTETKFLSERELPECARLTSNNDEEIMETIEDKDIQKAILASRQSNPSGTPVLLYLAQYNTELVLYLQYSDSQQKWF